MSTQYDDPNSTIDLSQFDDQFEQTQVTDRNAKVPDGKYIARIDKVELKKTKKGDPMLAWDLVIEGPTETGRHVFTNNVIGGNPTGLSILKTNLSMCQLQLAKLSDLSSRLGELLDVVLEVSVKNKPASTPGGYENQDVYFNKFVGKGENAYVASVSAESSVPF